MCVGEPGGAPCAALRWWDPPALRLGLGGSAWARGEVKGAVTGARSASVSGVLRLMDEKERDKTWGGGCRGGREEAERSAGKVCGILLPLWQ